MVSPNKFNVSKINAACHQLNKAFLLLIDEGDAVCAHTLAGAAEEILGQALGQDAFAYKVRDNLSKQTGETEKNVMKEMNKGRNWLKHLDDSTQIHEEIDAEWLNPLQMIIRGFSNVILLRKNGLSILKLPCEDRFHAFMQNYPNMTTEYIQSVYCRE